MASSGAVESGREEEVLEEVWFVFVLLPVACGFWVMTVTIDETIVEGWPDPELTKVDTKVEVKTVGRELFPPPDAEEIEFEFPLPLPEELLD